VAQAFSLCGFAAAPNDAPEITVLQLPKFKAEAADLIGPDGLEALAAYLIDRHLYVVIAAPIYLMRCYARNVKTDLTAYEPIIRPRVAANLFAPEKRTPSNGKRLIVPIERELSMEIRTSSGR
jgi:hypothetical protein